MTTDSLADVGVQVLATDAVWKVFGNSEAVAFVASYCAGAYSNMSAADALSWEVQQRLKSRTAQVPCCSCLRSR